MRFFDNFWFNAALLLAAGTGLLVLVLHVLSIDSMTGGKADDPPPLPSPPEGQKP